MISMFQCFVSCQGDLAKTVTSLLPQLTVLAVGIYYFGKENCHAVFKSSFLSAQKILKCHFCQFVLWNLGFFWTIQLFVLLFDFGFSFCLLIKNLNPTSEYLLKILYGILGPGSAKIT